MNRDKTASQEEHLKPIAIRDYNSGEMAEPVMNQFTNEVLSQVWSEYPTNKEISAQTCSAMLSEGANRARQEWNLVQLNHRLENITRIGSKRIITRCCGQDANRNTNKGGSR